MSDRTIRASIQAGASTLEAVSECTGAATCCGGCEPTVADILDEELGARSASPHVTPLRPLRILRDPRAA